MLFAHITVDADRSALVTVSDESSHYPDLGAAMSAVAAFARTAGQTVTAQLEDGNGSRTLVFDASGRLQPNPVAVPDPSPAAMPPSPLHSPTDVGTAQHTSQHDAGQTAAATSHERSSVDSRFAGPAEPGTRNRRRNRRPADRSARKQPNAASRLSKSFSIPGLVLTILLIGVLIAYFVPNIIGSPSNSSPENITNSESSVSSGNLSVQDADAPVPGFAQEPAWEHKVSQTASVTATERGVLVVDGNLLSVLDPQTGEERFHQKLDSELEFAVDTIADGKQALVWRVGDFAWALPDGQSDATIYALPQNARVSSAGSSILIKDGNELKTLGKKDLRSLPTPSPGSTPMALDGTTLISAGFSGPITRTDIDSGASQNVTLEKPSDDLNIIRWVSAGHGKVVTLWGEDGASTNSGHRIQLVVNDLQTGKITSTVETTTDVVGEASWTRGQGYQLAVIGPYLFSIDDGLLVRDGSEDEVQLSEPKGPITPAVIGSDSTLLEGDIAWRSDTELLAVGGQNTFAVVRSSPTRVVGYTAD